MNYPAGEKPGQYTYFAAASTASTEWSGEIGVLSRFFAGFSRS
jgi:hypothetical protein